MNDTYTAPPLCGCGCGFPVRRSKAPPFNWNRFITGHNARLQERKAKGVNYEASICAQCGTTYMPKRRDQRTCSIKCRQQLNGREIYLRTHENKEPDKERACGVCGAIFPRIDRFDWKRKYCSDTCARTAVKHARKKFHERNPDARKAYRANENPAWQSTTARFFLRYPDVLRACMVCGESRVVDLHHKTPRNGAPARAKNTTRENVWVLCPNHHAMIERGIATPADLGLE